MKITVVGTGYVGLVTGTCLAEMGNSVVCIDIDERKVNMMKEGKLPIYEPDLERIFHGNIADGRLHFSTNLQEGVDHGDIIFLALPTPPNEDGSADLQYIQKVAEDLSTMITSYKVVVDKSTVPVGTADLVSEILGKNLSKDVYDVVSNPEFLREGVAVSDFMKPDRVVIGTSNPRAAEIMRKLYAPFVRQGNPVIVMDERSAEMTKYAANAYLAMRISYMNEIANLCNELGANVDMVRKGIGSDSRIGKRFLFPGIGYGGSCFPKDVKALSKMAKENAYDFKILDAVLDVNARQKKIMLEAITKEFGDDLSDKKFAIWGLSFKPNTDDIREAPSLEIIDGLLARGASLSTFDPEAMPNVRDIYGERIDFEENQYNTLEGADALLVMTEWTQFRTPHISKMKEKLSNPIIFDGRNIFDPIEMRNFGFTYWSVGRP